MSKHTHRGYTIEISSPDNNTFSYNACVEGHYISGMCSSKEDALSEAQGKIDMIIARIFFIKTIKIAEKTAAEEVVKKMAEDKKTIGAVEEAAIKAAAKKAIRAAKGAAIKEVEETIGAVEEGAAKEAIKAAKEAIKEVTEAAKEAIKEVTEATVKAAIKAAKKRTKKRTKTRNGRNR